MQVLLLTAFVLLSVRADVYLHSVRGSNNRLDEANRERNNANRMFDSQNNDRGGYNVGKLNYYATEEVPITFTLQHGCGTEDVKHCDVVIQALCDPLIRDGTTTQRIPTNPANCRNFNCDTDPQFGRHESYEYYMTCEATQRNQGLFQASQQPNRGDATRTRQNPGGTRRGYECPEERDYYPYWNPSPWIDLAVYTKDTGKCEMYQRESQNVKSRWYCDIPAEVIEAQELGNIARTPITQEACEALTSGGANATTAKWTEYPANGFPAPECMESLPSRPNHLGLVGGETQWTYRWKVPEQLVGANTATPGQSVDEPETGCVFRLRYNISEDYDGTAPAGVDLTTFPSGTQPVPNPDNSPYQNHDVTVDAQFNRNQGGGGNPNNRPSSLDVWTKYGLEASENGQNEDGTMQNFNDGNNGQNLGDIRDYTLRNNPKPDALGTTYGNDDYRLRLQLAVNTAQYGRTFQDRTHVAYVIERPEELGNSAIKHVTVQGKRGNIVQVFPGTEYFFVPETVHARQYDAIHFSWSGSNTNPNNNDGQGRQGTDRSNVCPMKDSNYEGNPAIGSYTQGGMGKAATNKIGSPGGSYPAFVKEPEGYALAQALSDCGTPEMVQKPIAGFPLEAASALCTGRREGESNNDFGNMEELDDGPTSFNMKPIQATETGCWSYVSTRNNNFSNRSQKGTICIDEGDYGQGEATPSGGAVTSDAAWIDIPPGAITQITTLTIESKPADEAKIVSDVYMIQPLEFETLAEDENGNKAELEFAIPYSQRALMKQRVEHKVNGEWVEVENSKMELGKTDKGAEQTMAMAKISEGGEYRVVDQPNAGAIVAIVLSGLVFMMTILFLCYYQHYRKNNKPDDFTVGSTN